MIIFILIINIMVLSSCSFNNQTSSDKLVARLGDNYLYKSDLKQLNNYNLDQYDSIYIYTQFIENWAKENLILNKALINLDIKDLEIEKRVESYKNSLLIHSYEQNLIKQKLDTLVSINEITEYYKNHLDDFILSNKILKIIFSEISIYAPQIDSMKFWFFNSDSIYFDKIEEYSYQYSKRLFYNHDEWVTIYDLEEFFANKIEFYNLTDKNNTIFIEDSLSYFFIRLTDFKDVGSYAPVDYVKKDIIEIILNKRKLKMIEIIKNKLFDDAKKSNIFEIYENI